MYLKITRIWNNNRTDKVISKYEIINDKVEDSKKYIEYTVRLEDNNIEAELIEHMNGTFKYKIPYEYINCIELDSETDRKLKLPDIYKISKFDEEINQLIFDEISVDELKILLNQKNKNFINSELTKPFVSTILKNKSIEGFNTSYYHLGFLIQYYSKNPTDDISINLIDNTIIKITFKELQSIHDELIEYYYECTKNKYTTYELIQSLNTLEDYFSSNLIHLGGINDSKKGLLSV